MPVVRVDAEVYNELQARATAFVDTPNDVIRRLLGLPSKQAAEKEPSLLWFLNSNDIDWGYLVENRVAYCDEDLNTRISERDQILLYVNRVGAVAVGRINNSVQGRVVRSELYPAYIGWQQLRHPIRVETIRQLCGQCPIQKVQRVKKGRETIEILIKELTARLWKR